eukprot:gnl/MRDRNA2_/MRDRNA2_187480_c0_seq1.p1 gnl/MRDRNA2_/MRDRNA2_187480_c0~~gnl/MRDRNA2_/MRDRNA2_187480_c0_seq1.p1  ORF type:complete len:223 (-),score=19.06 gnl/MRDRNA2_/MRDRNA2_187480_c0_seq1:51-665(-)
MSPVSTIAPFWGTLYGGYQVGRYLQPDDSAVSVAKAGAIGGFTSSFLYVPMNAVKCIAQDRRCSSLQALHVVRSQGGLPGLYRGWFVTVTLFSVPGSAAFYFTYEMTKQNLSHAWWAPFIAGGVSGIVEWTVGMPGDTIRTRYQTEFRYVAVQDCIADILSTGPWGFFRGYSAALPRAFVCNAASLAGIEAVQYAYYQSSSKLF